MTLLIDFHYDLYTLVDCTCSAHVPWPQQSLLSHKNRTRPLYLDQLNCSYLIMTSWYQKEFTLPRKSKGIYLVTREILAEIESDIAKFKIGSLNLFIKHTSCGLTLNENFDPSVRDDFNNVLDHLVPYDEPYYTHNDEGPDDLPGHVKSSLFGTSLDIPITNGKLNLGTWQGVYFCEFREYLHTRTIVATVNGALK